jgi:hypothetical protein
MACSIGVGAVIATVPSSVRAESTVFLTTSNLIQIEAGEGHYFLWAILPDARVPLGPFNVENDGVHLMDLLGRRISRFTTPVDLRTATEIWVTVEPESSSGIVPSNHHVMAGTVVNNVASISPNHPSALGLDFSTATGGFILDTPTTAANVADYASGVWFLTPGSPDGSGLELPALPEGWCYETWLTDAASADPVPMSMGTFDDPQGPDVNGGGGGAGSDAPYPFPGHDFLYPYESQPVSPNLTRGQWTLVVSIEPKPNTGPNPFHSLEPLDVGRINNLARREAQTMVNTSNQFPYATATITTTSSLHPTSWSTVKALYR